MHHTLKAGYSLTATAGAKPITAHMNEDAAIGAVIQPGFSSTFGPYLVERNFTVSDGATVSTAAADIVNVGGLLLVSDGAPADAVAATANVNPTGNDNSLTFTANEYGAAGNGISVRYNDPGGTTASLAVSVDGQAITVSLARAVGAITSTAAEIKAALEAVSAAARLVTIAIHTGDTGVADDGSGIVTAMAPASLATGAGFGIGQALPGALCFDTTNADVYRNDGTTAAPVWVKVGDAP